MNLQRLEVYSDKVHIEYTEWADVVIVDWTIRRLLPYGVRILSPDGDIHSRWFSWVFDKHLNKDQLLRFSSDLETCLQTNSVIVMPE